MHSFVICPLRDSKKIDLEICLAGCASQWQCDPFNRAMCKTRAKEAEKGIGEPEPAFTTSKEQPEDADVTEKITEGMPAVLSSNKAEELYKQVLALKKEIEVRWFELGKILEEIFEGHHYINLGYANWKDFCEVALVPLDLKWRAIDYLRMTRKKCDEVGIGKEIAGEIGWSRLKEIVPVITKKNKDQWIDVARKPEMTVQVLNAKVRVARGKITEEESKILAEKMFFSLFKDQKDSVERTLELACRMTGSDSRGSQLEIVCVEFRATYESEDGGFSKKKIVSDLLNRIEAVMRVKLGGEVIDVETGEVLVEARE